MERKILIGIILIILGIGGIFGSVLMFNDTSKEFVTTSFDIPLGVVPPEIPVSWFLGFCSIIFFVVGIIYLIRGKLSTGKIIAVILLILVVSGGAIFWEFLTALDAINHYWAQNQEILSDKYCDTDDDCACGINKTTRSCFYGNKDYVDTMQQCLDFCTGIGGNFEIKCVNKECKQVSTIQDETADWKTYRNEEYGFEVKYPEDLVVEPLNPIQYTNNYLERLIQFNAPSIDPITGEPSVESRIWIMYYSDVSKYLSDWKSGWRSSPGCFPEGVNTLEEWLKASKQPNCGIINIPIFQEEISIDGNKAYKTIEHGCTRATHTCTSVMVEKNNHLYMIETEDEELLKQMLYTFNFLQ